MRADILIFCDGGLGNRINALVSGLAVARYFGLTYCVHWPINNWCAAPFQKIFANRLNVSTESISQLKGMLGDAVMLLHDEIASNTLGVKFNSAYRFKKIQDFGELASQKGKTIFYYPAVIPNWVPEELINKELKFLKFDTYIVKEVKDFISLTMPGPFYGLHLRRTDLNVGLDDLEVFNLAKSHPEATFFVCSDDPAAERLAAGHPNVFHREKKFQIEKKTESGDWLDQTHDDDGRMYYGNIQRNEGAVVEGTIDMLILAHSKIVGFSGSTFQKIAQVIGNKAPLMNVEQPQEINYISPKELEHQLKNGRMNTSYYFNIIQKLKDKKLELILLSIFLKYCEESQREYILYAMSICLISLNDFEIAEIYLKEIACKNKSNMNVKVNLALAQLMSGKINISKLTFEEININLVDKENVDVYKFISNKLNKLQIVI